MVKRSLANRPAGATGGWTLTRTRAPARSNSATKAPEPEAASP